MGASIEGFNDPGGHRLKAAQLKTQRSAEMASNRAALPKPPAYARERPAMETLKHSGLMMLAEMMGVPDEVVMGVSCVSCHKLASVWVDKRDCTSSQYPTFVCSGWEAISQSEG